MKRFLSVLVASMFLASAAYAQTGKSEEKKSSGSIQSDSVKTDGKAKSDSVKTEGKATGKLKTESNGEPKGQGDAKSAEGKATSESKSEGKSKAVTK
jgi:hypothetical protein